MEIKKVKFSVGDQLLNDCQRVRDFCIDGYNNVHDVKEDKLNLSDFDNHHLFCSFYIEGDNDKIIAAAYTERLESLMYRNVLILSFIHVLPEYQNNGLASQLIKAINDYCISHRYIFLGVEVNEDDIENGKLWINNGFTLLDDNCALIGKPMYYSNSSLMNIN